MCDRLFLGGTNVVIPSVNVNHKLMHCLGEVWTGTSVYWDNMTRGGLREAPKYYCMAKTGPRPRTTGTLESDTFVTYKMASCEELFSLCVLLPVILYLIMTVMKNK